MPSELETEFAPYRFSYITTSSATGLKWQIPMCWGNTSNGPPRIVAFYSLQADQVDHRRYAELFMHQELREPRRDLCARAAKSNGPGIREVARISAEGFSQLIHRLVNPPSRHGSADRVGGRARVEGGAGGEEV